MVGLLGRALAHQLYTKLLKDDESLKIRDGGCGDLAHFSRENTLSTSMHSSRMRTARLLTVWGGSVQPGGSTSRGVCLTLEGVCIQEGLPNPGGSASKGVCPTPGGLHPRGVCPTLGGLHPMGVCPIQGGMHPGKSAQPQGVCIGGGVCPTPGGSASRGRLGRPPCEHNDTQVYKHYLAPNFVCGRYQCHKLSKSTIGPLNIILQCGTFKGLVCVK